MSSSAEDASIAIVVSQRGLGRCVELESELADLDHDLTELRGRVSTLVRDLDD